MYDYGGVYFRIDRAYCLSVCLHDEIQVVDAIILLLSIIISSHVYQLLKRVMYDFTDRIRQEVYTEDITTYIILHPHQWNDR